MGMFDDITVYYPLPDYDAEHISFQTKDLDCFMDKYRITEDGLLEILSYDLVEDGTRMVLGQEITARKRVNEKWHPVHLRNGRLYTGELNFYTSSEETAKWYEYSALFIDGYLQEFTHIDIHEMPHLRKEN